MGFKSYRILKRSSLCVCHLFPFDGTNAIVSEPDKTVPIQQGHGASHYLHQHGHAVQFNRWKHISFQEN